MTYRPFAAIGVAIVLLAAGCGGAAEPESEGGATGDTVAVNEPIRQLLPESIRDRGTIRFATDPSYAPMESYAADGRTVIGFDADLAAALGSVLGIKLEMVPADFSAALDDTAESPAQPDDVFHVIARDST